jgi:hypothetical protein
MCGVQDEKKEELAMATNRLKSNKPAAGVQAVSRLKNQPVILVLTLTKILSID